MKGDFTRSTYDRQNHYRSVRMQQGRVQLDADWNEQADITLHRIETEAVDLIGGCGGPLHDAGFHLVLDAADLSAAELALEANADPDALAGPADFYISGGRYYTDGVLCENDHIVPYLSQPDLPGLAPETGAGTYLAYLDVWPRHLSALEAPAIREVALGGPDTATRTRVVWQVRLHPVTGPVDCVSSVDSWNDAIAPGTGLLGARAEAAEASTDPCIVTPGAGFRRLENQLYRVEVHAGGSRNASSFKWSRDNGAIAATWEAQNVAAMEELTVSHLGRDDVQRFASGQWVELTDDDTELRGEPGTLARIARAEGRIITIELGSATGSVDRNDFPSNPRVRRWDGVIDNVTNSDWVNLEDGVQIRLSNGTYHTGDYWQIPARTATGDVEWPRDTAGEAENVLPHGILHHYCRLALLEFDGTAFTSITDCRHLFPPVTQLTSLFYVGGDGQEAMPDLTTPSAGADLPYALQVGAANGEWPVQGAIVRFEISEGSGRLDTQSGPVEVATGADGVASVQWRLGTAGTAQRVEATLLDAAGNALHLPLRFTARFSTAGNVAYQPGACPTLAGSRTVQDALDTLCLQGGAADEPGVHVTELRFGDGTPLLNDTMVSVASLADGFRIGCDDRLFDGSVNGKPVVSVTLQLPFPLIPNDVQQWGAGGPVGYQPLELRAKASVDGEAILWQPADDTRTWLLQSLLSLLQEYKWEEPILCRIVAKGRFIWAEKPGNDGAPRYLDGEAFGAIRDDGSTDAVLPSGDRRRGGDLEMWFRIGRDEDRGLVLVIETAGSSVTGRVSLETGAPVPGAIVELSGGALPAPRATVTDLDGNFAFRDVPPGTYLVTVRAGSDSLERTITVSQRESTGPFRRADHPDLTLTDVTGIGNTFANRLLGNGIEHPADVANMSEAELATALDIPESRARRVIEATRNLLLSRQ